MREQEMRLRVFRFLKARMRNMIMPAAVGIGLSAGACKTEGSLYMGPIPSDAAMVKSDVNREDVSVLGPEVSAADVPPNGQDVAAPVDQAVAFDLAPGPDAVDSGLADAAADVFAPLDGQPDLRYPEAGMKYMGPTPLDAAASEAGGEAGIIIAKYVAPMPDAARDGMLVVRYMAQMPDTGA